MWRHKFIGDISDEITPTWNLPSYISFLLFSIRNRYYLFLFKSASSEVSCIPSEYPISSWRIWRREWEQTVDPQNHRMHSCLCRGYLTICRRNISCLSIVLHCFTVSVICTCTLYCSDYYSLCNDENAIKHTIEMKGRYIDTARLQSWSAPTYV